MGTRSGSHASPAARFPWEGLLDPRPLRWRECIVALSGLLVLGSLVYLPYMAGGGFISDDWLFHSDARLHSLGDAIRRIADAVPERPVESVYQATLHTVLGDGVRAYLVWAVVSWVLAVFLFFTVLRQVGLERLHAGSIAILVFVYPASDATRFWAVASVYNVALALYLGGVALALHGLTRQGRGAACLHAAAVLLYVLSILVHEIAVVPVALSVLVYRLRAPWRLASRLWLVDLAFVGAAIVYVSFQSSYKVKSISYQIEHAWSIAREARTLFATTGILDGPVRLPPLLVAVVVLAAVAVWRLLPAADPSRRALSRWLLILGSGVAIVAVAYVPFVPANPSYRPLGATLMNRTNLFASLGFAVTLYALAMVGGTLLFRGLPRMRSLTALFGAVVAIGLAVTWTVELEQHSRSYNRATSQAREILDQLEDALGRPPTGTTVYLFGSPASVDGVPVFTNSFDLNGAIQLRWRDTSLRGVPWPAINGEVPFGQGGVGHGIACERDGLHHIRVPPEPSSASRYGRAVFVNVGSKRVQWVDNAADCETAVTEFLDPILMRP